MSYMRKTLREKNGRRDRDVLVCDKFGCKEQGTGGGDERHSDAEQRDNGSHDCAKCDVVSVRELKILRHKVG
jgi:hypothetical protein